ncbi:MAG: UDP-N-acetylmuramoyl-L-alanine--D-glutamate ligase [Oscillospiraceae bacterium]|nr:UDP-N-acetylmuramoyl-L-alanine--D-glutamate ligase [Oscillospiraceae bacterium]
MTLNEYVESIRDCSIAVLGIGISNLPLIELLCTSGCDVTACDRRTMEQLGETGARLLQLGAKLRLGEDYLEGLTEDLIFRTPGLMPFEPHLLAAKEQGSTVTSEMEIFFSLCPCRIFAVTGSDGKTTTTTLISELLKAAGHRVHLGGNIGTPLLCKLPEMKEDDLVVLELSSFQLHSMTCRPHTAVITNLSPNHLDKHKDFQDYIDAKAWIFRNQKAQDRLILNAIDPHTPYYASQAPSGISYFSDRSRVENGCICENGVISLVTEGELQPVMRADDIRIPGQHNVQNMLAAFEAVRKDVSPEICREVAMRFAGVPHRLEEIRQLHGVTYINDSIASSPTRTIAGLRALKTKPIVIAGGYDKHLPFDSLGEEFCRRAKAVILTGDTSDKIAAAIEEACKKTGLEVPVHRVDSMRDAVCRGAEIAAEGDIVILSPACASFDRFRNFEERGNVFRQFVMELKE